MQDSVINGFRLSPQQKRLWMLQKEHPGFRSLCAVRMEGNLDKAVLKNAVEKIINRHEILRTVFRSLPGMQLPVQIVNEHPQFSWEEVDFSNMDLQKQQIQIADLWNTEEQYPFNPEGEAPVRFKLLTLAARLNILLLSMPAFYVDTRSLKNLIKEITGLYNGEYFSGEDDILQYVQFSEWQHELMEEEDAETGRNFWRNQNFENIPDFYLPFENKNPDPSGFRPGTVFFNLEKELVSKIESFIQNLETGRDVFFLSCWQTLLWRLTGKPEIIVGDACDGRQHEVLYDALGLFSRWLPIRCRFQDHFKFEDVLSRIDQFRNEAYEWQEYFLPEEYASAFAGNGVFPYFPVGYEYDERIPASHSRELTISIDRLFSLTELFHLKLSVISSDHEVQLVLHYHPGRFHQGDVERLGRHLLTLMDNLIDTPQLPLTDLEILNENDRQQIIYDFNQTTVEFETGKCIHQVFEVQAAQSPDKIALVFGEQQLSFRELNNRANQIANYLLELGVGPETMVGLCMERSVEAITGILGILKAGGVYIPLEPTYPPERLAYILQDTGAPVVITQQQLSQNFSGQNLKIVCPDKDNENQIARQDDENPEITVAVENIAYVIYTSGSTGQPKGVMISHDSAVHLIHALNHEIYHQWETPLMVGLNAPLIFDASVKQILQLLNGHTLHILPEEIRPDMNALLQYIRRYKLDVLDCTPAQFRLLMDAGLNNFQKEVGKLRMLIGGENLDDSIWQGLKNNSYIQAFNVYGPTECTVDAAVCSIDKGPTEPSIGRPVANTRIYILDEKFCPQPIGVTGEIFIAGAGLARGYLNKPHLTAEKFLPNPFAENRGERFYRSGDMGSFFSDGNIKFSGRRDFQVKVRGFRIELGEIEAAVAQFTGVKENVVIVREDTPDNQQLVAYVVFQPGIKASINELRDFLRIKLPEYMVPSAFVTLTELPLTRNGKVDRKALPAPNTDRPDLKTEYIAPRNKIEQTVAEIWKETLQVEKVGVDDNFFDLGGHSLLMVKVHSKLRSEFNNEISLIEMFRNPTVGMLAKYLESGNETQPELQKARDRAQKRKSARSQQTTKTERNKKQ